jgi:aminopeptidase N
MMTDVRAYDRPWLFYHTLSHEVAHTYFPFYMGINERKYAFMDEGWAQMLPMGVQNRAIPALNPRYDARHKNTVDYEEAAGLERADRPPMVLSTNLDPVNYHNVNYDRPGAAYYFLQDVLGEERFGEALREFMRRWHHKHPTPTDFFNTFEDVLGEDLSWYWNPWFFEFGYPDLAVAGVEIGPDSRRVVIERLGRVPTPLQLTVTFDDDSTLRVYESARIWADGRRRHTVPLPAGKQVAAVQLGDRIIPDVDRTNNQYGEPGDGGKAVRR